MMIWCKELHLILGFITQIPVAESSYLFAGHMLDSGCIVLSVVQLGRFNYPRIARLLLEFVAISSVACVVTFQLISIYFCSRVWSGHPVLPQCFI